MNASFISASFSTRDCELYRNEAGNIQIYVPTREKCEATIELGTASFITAEVVAREMGLEPKWGI